MQLSGPGRRIRVTIDHNLLRDDLGILLQNSIDSEILDNDVIDGREHAIMIGAGNEGLLIAANRVRNAEILGIRFIENGAFLDSFPLPNRGVVVTRNEVTRSRRGIHAGSGTLADSLISENTSSENRGAGILLVADSTADKIIDNTVIGNLGTGISVNSGSGNVLRGNTIIGNGASGIALGFFSELHRQRGQ